MMTTGLQNRPASTRRYTLGTVTYNLARDWSLEQLIETCEEARFLAVELRTTHQHGVEVGLSSAQRLQVRRRFEESPVTLAGLGTTCEFHALEAAVVRRNIATAGDFIRLAADVGAAGIKVRPNGLPEGVPVPTTLRQIGEALQEVGREAESYDVEIWLEVHGRGSSHPPHIKKMMEHCAHPLVGVTWNCNPTDLEDGQLGPHFDLLQPHIRNVHIHDLTDPYPYRELFQRLRDSGYDRWTLAEIQGVEGDPLRFMNYYRDLWEEISSDSECE